MTIKSQLILFAMYKRFVSIILLSLVGVSCSKNSTASAPEPGVLIRKTVSYDTESGIGNAKTLTFSYYDQNKLVRIVDESGREIVGCSYDGDLIKKMFFYNYNSGLVRRIDYNYDEQQRLVSFDESYYEGHSHITEFIYNDDGIIYVTKEARTTDQTITNYYIENGMLMKYGIVSQVNFIYDHKNYPYKNIRGFDKIYLSAPFSIVEASNGSSIDTYESKENLVGFTNHFLPANEINYVYNEFDYPIKREVVSSSRTYTVEYYY